MFRKTFVSITLFVTLFGVGFLKADSPDRLRFEAIQLLQGGHYARAEPLLEKLLKINPSATNTNLLGQKTDPRQPSSEYDSADSGGFRLGNPRPPAHQ